MDSRETNAISRRPHRMRVAHHLNKISWVRLRSWGNSRVFKSSYFFLLIIPVAAKILSPLSGSYVIDVEWLDRPLMLNVELPFRWVLFYAMAIAFAVGQFVYGFACPDIVKEYASFAEYRQAHKGFAPIAHWLKWLTTRRRSVDSLENLNPRLCVALRVSGDATDRIQRALDQIRVRNDKYTRRALWEEYDLIFMRNLDDDVALSDVFACLRGNATRVKRGWLNVSAGFFLIGFAFLAAILWQNCEYVYNAWIGS